MHFHKISILSAGSQLPVTGISPKAAISGLNNGDTSYLNLRCYSTAKILSKSISRIKIFIRRFKQVILDILQVAGEFPEIFRCISQIIPVAPRNYWIATRIIGRPTPIIPVVIRNFRVPLRDLRGALRNLRRLLRDFRRVPRNFRGNLRNELLSIQNNSL